MKRRNFILVSLGAIGAVAVGAESCGTSHDAPQMLSALCDEPTLQQIGKTYLHRHPQESDPAKLKLLIKGKDVRNDFQEGNIVVIQGWVLSVTEARQCALLTL